MKISRRTFTWAAISAAPVLTALTVLGTHFVPSHMASTQPIATTHPMPLVVERTASVSSTKSGRIHLKRGHTYQLSLAQMSSIVGADGNTYRPGTVVTLPATYGASGDFTGASSGYWIVNNSDSGAGGTSKANGIGGYSYTNGWKVSYNRTTNIMSVLVSPAAVPGDSIQVLVKTGYIRLHLGSIQGEWELLDVGYLTYFTVN